MDPHKALESLLLSMFSTDELRRFLHYLPDGETLARALPGANATPATVAYEAVETLRRADYLSEPELWERLVAERPRRTGDIERVRVLITASSAVKPEPGVASATPDTAVRVTPTSPATAPSTSILTILLVSASPVDKVRLRVDTEFRTIINKLRSTRYRDRLRLVQVPAARYEDLRTALIEHEPHILHLSSHGSAGGSLVFEPRTDGSHVVTGKNLQRLLRALGTNLRLVVFNACNSSAIASEVAPIVGCSIGMNDDVMDAAAIEFSVALYEALAYGKSIQTAFEVAISGLDDDDDIPQLFPPEHEDIEQKRRQPLLSGGPT